MNESTLIIQTVALDPVELKLTGGSWELNLDPLKEQYMHLTTKPLPSPLLHLLKKYVLGSFAHLLTGVFILCLQLYSRARHA